MKKVKVVVAMGSGSDLKVMRAAADVLKSFKIATQTEILSAHRTPSLLEKSAAAWEAKGIRVVIAGAGGAAHLPGMLASFCNLPVIGVPVAGGKLNGLDSLLSIAQMPKGIPVATVAVDNAHNAGLLAVQILAQSETKDGAILRQLLKRERAKLRKRVLADRRRLGKVGIATFLKKS